MYLIVCEEEKIDRDEGREGVVGLIDDEGEKINSDERLRSCRKKGTKVSSSI